MTSEELQSRIRKGDRDAFLSFYDAHAKRVYLCAMNALDDDNAARSAVKQAFLLFRRDVMNSGEDLALEERLDALVSQEICTQRLLRGDLAAVMTSLPAQPSPAAPQQADAASSVPFASACAASPIHPIPPQDAPSMPPPPPAPRETRRTASAMDRVREHMREDGEPMGSAPRKHRPPQAHSERRGANTVVAILIGLLSALLLWIIVGILMDLDLLPFVDLGYTWFNQNVFPLFRL